MTQREYGRSYAQREEPQGLGRVLDAENIPDEQTRIAEQELLTAKRNTALREALTHLPQAASGLIAMLIEDPPVLHRYPAIAVLIDAEARTGGGEMCARPRCSDDDQ